MPCCRFNFASVGTPAGRDELLSAEAVRSFGGLAFGRATGCSAGAGAGAGGGGGAAACGAGAGGGAGAAVGGDAGAGAGVAAGGCAGGGTASCLAVSFFGGSDF